MGRTSQATRQPRPVTFTLRLPIHLPLKYPARVWFPGGAHSFTPEEEGSGKVRAHFVHIGRMAKAPE